MAAVRTRVAAVRRNRASSRSAGCGRPRSALPSGLIVDRAEKTPAGLDEGAQRAPSSRASLLERVRVLLGWPSAFDSRLSGIDRKVRSLEKRLVTRVEKAKRRLGESIVERTRIERSRLDVGRLDYAAAPIYLKLSSSQEVKRLSSCAKEPWTVDWIESFLERGETLYDVGANVGAYSLVAARQHEGDVRVIAFEPGFQTFASLCDNVMLNEVEDAVLPLPVALAAEYAISTLAYDETAAGSAGHRMGDGAPPGDDGTAYRQPLLTQPLDALRRTYSLPAPNHLKVDVDGPELTVLRGAVETLADPALRSMMIELSPRHREEIEAFLAEHGWTVHERFTRTWRKPKAKTPGYALFVRGEGALTVHDETAAARDNDVAASPASAAPTPDGQPRVGEPLR